MLGSQTFPHQIFDIKSLTSFAIDTLIFIFVDLIFSRHLFVDLQFQYINLHLLLEYNTMVLLFDKLFLTKEIRIDYLYVHLKTINTKVEDEIRELLVVMVTVPISDKV